MSEANEEKSLSKRSQNEENSTPTFKFLTEWSDQWLERIPELMISDTDTHEKGSFLLQSCDDLEKLSCKTFRFTNTSFEKAEQQKIMTKDFQAHDSASEVSVALSEKVQKVIEVSELEKGCEKQSKCQSQCKAPRKESKEAEAQIQVDEKASQNSKETHITAPQLQQKNKQTIVQSHQNHINIQATPQKENQIFLIEEPRPKKIKKQHLWTQLHFNMQQTKRNHQKPCRFWMGQSKKCLKQNIILRSPKQVSQIFAYSSDLSSILSSETTFSSENTTKGVITMKPQSLLRFNSFDKIIFKINNKLYLEVEGSKLMIKEGIGKSKIAYLAKQGGTLENTLDEKCEVQLKMYAQ